jgi:hypothetical protein
MAISSKKPLKTIPKNQLDNSKSIFKAEIVEDENDIQLPIMKEVNKIAPNEKNNYDKDIQKLHLGSLDGCQRSIARVANAVFQDKMDNKKARTLTFVLRVMLESWRVKAENSIILLDKIERLEKQMKSKNID